MKILLVLLIATSSAALAAVEHRIPEEDLVLGGISLGHEQGDVIRLLGQPSRQSVIYGSNGQLLFEYPGLEVVFVDGEVDQLTSKSATICTPSKVCPGMSLDEVRKIYGHSPLIREGKRTVVQYYPPVSDCWLELSLRSNRVESIRARCQV